MAAGGSAPIGFDVFLSHGGPDKPWVQTLRDELGKLGLRAFLDVRELQPGENWTLRLSQELLHSRAMALVLSAGTLQRGWVDQEWTSFLAAHGPTAGRLVPVLLDDVVLPPFLNTLQAINARHRDAAQTARELAERVGRPGTLPEGDVRRLYFGQDLAFVLERGTDGDGETPTAAATLAVAVIDPTGRRREIVPPWRQDSRFTAARIGFSTLSRQPVESDADRAELHKHAVTLGELLFGFLFDDRTLALLGEATLPGQPRPLVTIRSDDVALQALPWELLHHDGRFLVRDGVVDLARSDTRPVGPGGVLPAPAPAPAAAASFVLVVNVSAPEGSGLDYETESYRITRALADHCDLIPTELGSLQDLVETVAARRPTGLHFSGHGGPGFLVFEDDEGRESKVDVAALVDSLRRRDPAGRLPAFFYLANCHGNDPAALRAGQPGVESLAARLHRDGVAQVVAYSGPIVDALSTEAEVMLYAALAAGHTTRFAVGMARDALRRPAPPTGRVVLREPSHGTNAQQARATHPFAWSQLVLYHRGPDHPLSPLPDGTAAPQQLGPDMPQRTFLDAGTRRLLTTGFIGRRTELHALRRRVRAGQRVFVLQGLGGLGKSTLALHMIRDILRAGNDLCTLWCQDAEKAEGPDGIAVALLGQLLDFCRKRFGAGWEAVVQQVDRLAGDDPARRFAAFLDVLVANVPRLVVYLDNLESLLVGPAAAADPAAFAGWRTPALGAIWSALAESARDTAKLHLVASCRYRHADFRGQALIPVSPLPRDALFRLMGWFPGLRRLCTASRAGLVRRLEGHPRAVEFANDLVEHALEDWEENHGRPWRLPDAATADDLAREWSELVEPVLPQVGEQLRDDLLFDALWDRVLDPRARCMLYRMTLLRRPWDAELMRVLGDEDEPPEVADATARRLSRTSLLEQVELRTDDGPTRFFTIHPATAHFVADRFGTDPALCLATHRRVGTVYDARARISPYIEDNFEAGHHLFQAGEYDRSCELLEPASAWLQNHGRVREGLQILEPFLAGAVRDALEPLRRGRLLGAVGTAYFRLGQAERAIGYFEQQVKIAREIGDRQSEGNGLTHLGVCYKDLGQVKRAIGYYEQALVIDRELGDRRGEGADLGNLGIAYARLGEVERAIGSYEQQLVIAREIGDRGGEGNALGSLGNAYANLGEVERAIGYYEQALVIIREIGDRRGEGNALGSLGTAYARLGEVEQAIGYYEQQLVIVHEIGDRRGEGIALGNLGTAYAHLGEVERAIGSYEQQLVIVREIGDRRGEGNALGNLGVAYADLGEVERAIGYYEQQLVIVREIGDRQGEGVALGNLGIAYARLGEVERAIGYLEQALSIGQEIKDPRIVQNVTANLERLRGGGGTVPEGGGAPDVG
jgi:tetratricopeptide (TPR) repeat protein